MPQGFTASSFFTQIIAADLNNRLLQRFHLTTFMQMISFFACLQKGCSQKDLVQHKVLNKKIAICSNLWSEIQDNLIWERGLLLDPERLQGILNFLYLKVKCELQGLLGLGHGWIPNLLMAEPLCAIQKNTKLDPIVWDDQYNFSFKTLKEGSKSTYPQTPRLSATLFLFCT